MKLLQLELLSRDFLSVLVSLQKIFFLNKISQNFLTLVSKQKGELKTSLTSSKILTNDEIKNLNIELKNQLEKKLQKTGTAENNKSRKCVKKFMIDTSIKNKLKKYEQTMLEI